MDASTKGHTSILRLRIPCDQDDGEFSGLSLLNLRLCAPPGVVAGYKALMNEPGFAEVLAHRRDLHAHALDCAGFCEDSSLLRHEWSRHTGLRRTVASAVQGIVDDHERALTEREAELQLASKERKFVTVAKEHAGRRRELCKRSARLKRRSIELEFSPPLGNIHMVQDDETTAESTAENLVFRESLGIIQGSALCGSQNAGPGSPRQRQWWWPWLRGA